MSIFSFIGKVAGGALGGVLGGPAGAAAGWGAASAAFGPKGGSSIMRSSPPINSFNGTTPGYAGAGTMYPPPAINVMRSFPPLPQGPVNQTGLVNIVRPGVPGSTMGPPGNQTQSGGGALVGRGGHTPCAAGYHYNKTGYFTKRYGWIEKGTVCVKNRRRNPLNAKALNRAGRRLVSAKKAAHFLDRIHFGAKPTHHRRAHQKLCK